MNKEEIKQMAKTEEQVLASGIKGIPLGEWQSGKEFLAMTDRTFYIFDPSVASLNDGDEDLTGKILKFSHTETRLTPDLREECIIVFSDGHRAYRYPTGKSPEEAMKTLDSSKLPLISDLRLIEEWKEKIKGKTLWTRSNLWYDERGQRIDGLRFSEISVTDVIPSTGDFPMKIKIQTPEGHIAYMNMNYTADLPDSRNFAALFFLSNPRSRYPQIIDSNWELIKRGRVAQGMTKEECRLSLGNPDELFSGHSTSSLQDIWQYSNGTYLMFTDGLLTTYRQ